MLMGTQMESLLLVIVGVLAVLYRKKFVTLLMWYHRRRWYRQAKRPDKKLEYPEEAWSAANRFAEVLTAIVGVGLIFCGIGMLAQLLGYPPRISVIHHSEERAAQKAAQFAEVVFVRQDYERAYTLLSEELREKVPFEKFKGLILQGHVEGFPTVVKATDFEPLPGRKAMGVFLDGANSGLRFYYRLIMQGTKATDYQVSDFQVSKEPYPRSSLTRPLKRRSSQQ
jgi:hypothetical protein